MIKKGLIGLGTLIVGLAVVFAGWFYRPWSEYSPAEVLEWRDMDDRVPAYRAMKDVFPSREIPSSPNVVTLPRDLHELDIRYTYNGFERTLEDYAADYDITGLMLVKDDKVVFEKYWRGETADDLHTSWSVAKSFIATLIGVAIKEGKIESLDDPAEKYAPIYTGTDYGRTSIRHLLMMSSGIEFNEDYEVIGSDIRKLFFNTFILNKDIDKFVRAYQRNREPGTDFEYQSPNTSVLGAVISGAYGGTPLATLAGEKIFAPAGMQGGNWLLDRNTDKGKELAYCCINIRLEDYAKFGLLYMNEGLGVQGEQVLPEGWGEFVGTAPDAAHMEDVIAQGGQYGYGHHFWVPQNADGAFFAAGYNAQFVWIDPKRRIVLAMTSADTKYPDTNKETHSLHWAAVNAAAALAD